MASVSWAAGPPPNVQHQPPRCDPYPMSGQEYPDSDVSVQGLNLRKGGYFKK